MSELTNAELAQAEQVGGAALATIVRRRGSTPREVGARMLIYRDGRTLGTIGGGCGEAEVRQAALEALDRQSARLLKVDLMGGWGDDREVCGGVMDVLIEPLGAAVPLAKAAAESSP